MHAMFALTRGRFSAGLALDVGVKLKHGLLFDHDPGDPSISYGEQEEQSDHSTGTKGEELDAEGKSEEDTSGEDVDRPFESHQITLISTFQLTRKKYCLHAEGRRVHVHVAVLHHLPHLFVQLAVATHALHHLAGTVPLTDEFTHVLFSDA